MPLIHILIRDNEFANENTDYDDYRQYDKHYLISSDEYTDEKREELKALLDLYDKYQDADYDVEVEGFNLLVADTTKYHILSEFFSQFTNYMDLKISEVYIG